MAVTKSTKTKAKLKTEQLYIAISSDFCVGTSATDANLAVRNLLDNSAMPAQLVIQIPFAWVKKPANVPVYDISALVAVDKVAAV